MLQQQKAKIMQKNNTLGLEFVHNKYFPKVHEAAEKN